VGAASGQCGDDIMIIMAKKGKSKQDATTAVTGPRQCDHNTEMRAQSSSAKSMVVCYLCVRVLCFWCAPVEMYVVLCVRDKCAHICVKVLNVSEVCTVEAEEVCQRISLFRIESGREPQLFFFY
jgi:hypothetical protein